MMGGGGVVFAELSWINGFDDQAGEFEGRARMMSKGGGGSGLGGGGKIHIVDIFSSDCTQLYT